MSFSIRAAKEDDAADMVELLNSIIRAGAYTVMQQVSIDSQIDFIRRFPERGVLHVAECNNSQRIVGLQDVMPTPCESTKPGHVGEISTFVSLPRLRTGIGRALCQATFPAAREKRFLKLCATVRADNPGAVSFYRRHGFQVVGTTQKHAFVHDMYVDAVRMEKRID